MAITMVTRKRTKLTTSSRRKSSRRTVALSKGDWLDVMDADGVWNVARVLSVRSSDEVEVTYDGWDEVYNEVVCMDSDRVAPYHTFTWAVKCWVKYLNWPLWPAVITIRTPGTEEGIVNLAKENRLWVDFFDHPNFMKRDRCWQKKSQVKIFDDHYDENGFGACGKEFDQSLELMLKSDATTEMPKFAKGTVPVEYKDITTESVDQKRNSMGDNLWFNNFADNRERHYQIHIYDMIGNIKMKVEDGVNGDKTTDNDKPASVTKVQPKKSAARKNTAQTVTRKKRPLTAKLSPAKEKEESPVKVEVPYELGEISSSDDSPDEMAGQTKKRRRRLKTRREISEGVVSRASTKNNGHVKGPLKMAARRSTPPLGGYLNLSAIDELNNYSPTVLENEDDDEDERRGPLKKTVEDTVETSSVKTKSTVKRRTSHTRKETQKVASDYVVPPESSSQTRPPRSAGSVLPLIEQRIADAQETLRKLEQAKLEAVDTEKEKKRASSNTGISPSSASSRQHEAQLTSAEVNVSRPQRGNAERFLLERIAGKEYVYSDIDETRKGRVKETSVDQELSRAESNHSLLSVSKEPSSDSDESKGIPSPLEEEMPTDLPSNEEEAKIPEQAAVKIRSTPCSPCKVLELEEPLQSVTQRENSHGDDKEEKESQEPRRRFCVMQVGKEDDVAVDANAKVKYSKKTAISVPRKFDEAFDEKRNLLMSSESLMLRIAPPPQIAIPPLSVPGVRFGVALASPSTAVFSSSERFSMESWFKRKLYSDFMKR